MTSVNRFPICTTDVPPMLGRAEIMTKLLAQLTGGNPPHRSIVAPRYLGKSVFLKELAERVRGIETGYVAVIEWDLGHSTPRTDEEFLSQLCSVIGSELRAKGKEEEGSHLIKVVEDYYAEICVVVELLQEEGEKVLVLFDGFDRPLNEGQLTRDLWDNLRELCLKPAFRLVTATRKELSELIRDEKSVTSDFWNIFGDIVRLGPYLDKDVTSVLESWPELKLEKGGRTELVNWTGFSPPLLLSVLNHLPAEGGAINNVLVKTAAEEALESVAPYIDSQFRDCGSGAQDLATYLIDDPSGITEFSNSTADELVSRGFAKRQDNKLFPACRLLERRLADGGDGKGSLSKLFSLEENYKDNIIGVLQRRVAQIEPFDPQLTRYVSLAIKAFSEEGPEDALCRLSSIEERALMHVWELERADDKKVPHDTIVYWTKGERGNNGTVRKMMGNNDFAIPNDRTQQLVLLKLLTGSQPGFESKSKCTSKDTYVLLDAIHSARNREEHKGAEPVAYNTAVVTLFACVELLDLLARERP